MPLSSNVSQFGLILIANQSRSLFPHAESVVMDQIQSWSDWSLEPEPMYAPYEGLRWNEEWLKEGKLVCLCNMAELLEVAIWHGIPFAIFVKCSTIYEPGFQDITLDWSKRGVNAAAFNTYQSNVGTFLACPEAPIVVPEGGVMRYVAELFDPEILQRFIRGPSLQVLQFNKGESRLFKGPHGEEFWTRDHITWSEHNILLGYIAGENPDEGYLSAGAMKILNGLKEEYFADPLNLHWYTVSQWTGHFQGGCMGKNKGSEPIFVPEKDHWVEGKELFAHTYPKDWEIIDLVDIHIPEEFEPGL
ncbi:hypothetical protein K438DRAFT_1931422 [Mycena galopus ATCC 62051]|nr:hypothetical protein K438DRAFT_1931422 [Mycena galopus ATCC 62051]